MELWHPSSEVMHCNRGLRAKGKGQGKVWILRNFSHDPLQP